MSALRWFSASEWGDSSLIARVVPVTPLLDSGLLRLSSVSSASLLGVAGAASAGASTSALGTDATRNPFCLGVVFHLPSLLVSRTTTKNDETLRLHGAGRECKGVAEMASFGSGWTATGRSSASNDDDDPDASTQPLISLAPPHALLGAPDFIVQGTLDESHVLHEELFPSRHHLPVLAICSREPVGESPSDFSHAYWDDAHDRPLRPADVTALSQALYTTTRVALGDNYSRHPAAHARHSALSAQA
ncbi:hypothetical protein AURDEDRAFT_165722 [Auricularia subglabra TFB-10046 SS5]|nr:hypothetical protein AURDEDRAFT_165722 [Auricularia subglabra TFB-10046 SS5]